MQGHEAVQGKVALSRLTISEGFLYRTIVHASAYFVELECHYRYMSPGLSMTVGVLTP